MDLFTIAGACLRRWYITVPLLLLVGFFSYRAYASVDPLYTSSRSVVVLPSLPEETVVLPEDEDAATTVEVDNPYSGQGGSRFAVAVLTRNINSLAFKERLQMEPGVEQNYEASSSSQQPMIHIEAVAASPEAVYTLLDQVIGEAAVVLDSFQAEAGAPELTRYRIAPAVPAGPVEDATPSRLRAAGAIAVLGSGLVAAIVVGGDALLSSRRRRREAISNPASSARHRTTDDPVPAEPIAPGEPPQDEAAADHGPEKPSQPEPVGGSDPTTTKTPDQPKARPASSRATAKKPNQPKARPASSRATAKKPNQPKPTPASSSGPTSDTVHDSDVYGAQATVGDGPEDVKASEPTGEDQAQAGEGRSPRAPAPASITSKD